MPLLSRTVRPLGEAERRYAWELFVEGVDLDRVRLRVGGPLTLGPPWVFGDTVFLPEDFGGQALVTPEGQLTPAGRRVLIHELGHVWQHQHGGYAYIGDSLFAQALAVVRGEGRRGAYVWQQAARDGLPWEDWNPEQQATAIEHYDTCRRRVGRGDASENDHLVVSALLPIIEKVRRGEGAPRFSRAGAAVGALVFGVAGGAAALWWITGLAALALVLGALSVGGLVGGGGRLPRRRASGGPPPAPRP